MAEGSDAPIFVVGCQRSGTTMLRLMLDSHPSISCGPETRFLAGLARITGEDWHRLSRYGFPKEYWQEQVARFFDKILSDYATSRGKTRWADKTPLYARSLDFLTESFPTCQVVHVVRDGRDVVLSHRKRFGYLSAVKAVRKWPMYIAAARATGDRLPVSRYREVRYEDLVGDTEGTMRALLDWLGEPWDATVLDFDKQPHDVPDKYVELTAQRRRGEGSRGAVYRARAGAHRRELDPALRLLAWLFDRRALRELGYR
jgi:hypothetical protein